MLSRIDSIGIDSIADRFDLLNTKATLQLSRAIQVTNRYFFVCFLDPEMRR